ncbi:MAG: nucleotide pyrophosphatase [Candidatus Aminicenantes bacterium]|nr:MAG: nucleotide pyrophosphatase [Candidatus Aminicenantes bacterium]
MMDPIYIVSGLPRSGTSMVMQVLEAGGMPIATDKKREPDESNPKGYLEIESIINKLKDNPDFVFNFKGKVLKVIAYGLQFLPHGNYHIIYVERNIEEILDSMEKMMGAKDEEREDTKAAFIKLNDKTKAEIIKREDIKALFVNYNEILSSSKEPLDEIFRFLQDKNLDLEKMMEVVDNRLYRQRRLG